MCADFHTPLFNHFSSLVATRVAPCTFRSVESHPLPKSCSEWERQVQALSLYLDKEPDGYKRTTWGPLEPKRYGVSLDSW